MRTEQIIKRLEELEAAGEMETVLILFPNEDGTYTAQDQHHQGQVYTEESKNKHKGPVIIWD